MDLVTKPRLLLVDDDPDTLEVSALILGERYSVASCGSAREALAVVEAVAPQVIVLDVGMSPVDGVQCLQAIRAIPEQSHVPAIAWTAFAHDRERQAFIDAGFQAVVTKPLADYGTLEVLIDALLETPVAAVLDGEHA